MTYGRSVRKALGTFDLDHNKWPELAVYRSPRLPVLVYPRHYTKYILSY